MQILLQVLAAQVALVGNAQTRHAITKRSNLVIEISAVALLDHVVCRMMFGGQ